MNVIRPGLVNSTVFDIRPFEPFEKLQVANLFLKRTTIMILLCQRNPLFSLVLFDEKSYRNVLRYYLSTFLLHQQSLLSSLRRRYHRLAPKHEAGFPLTRKDIISACIFMTQCPNMNCTYQYVYIVL